MRIGLNIIGLPIGSWGGVETYFRNLLHYLQMVDSKNEYTLLCDKKNASQFPLFNPLFAAKPYHFARPSIPWIVRGVLRHGFDIDILKPLLSDVPLDVMHHPFTVLSPKGLKTPSVLTFADMQHEFYPDYFSPLQLGKRKRHYRSSAEQATRIIVHAEFTKKCLIERYGIHENKIDIIYTGYGPDYKIIDDQTRLSRTRKKYGLTTSFLYYPAATWPHKNHRNLLEAVSILRTRKQFDGQLVLTGIAMQSHADLIKDIERLNLSSMVKVLGYLPYEELPALFNLARVLVFPSLFEGFGIPLVEAMACGCPVVCSNTTSLPEVIGNAGILFDPASPEDIADKIRQVWQDDSLVKEMRDRGLERAKLFNWETTARKTISTYEKAART